MGFILQLCTTAFIVEISQYIMIGELTNAPRDYPSETLRRSSSGFSTPGTPQGKGIKSIPSFRLDGIGYFEGTDSLDDISHLNDEEEDAMVKDSTASFADWVTGFIRRVIILLENLPEEGATGVPTGGASESKLVISQAVVFLTKCAQQRRSSMPLQALAAKFASICPNLSMTLC